MPPGELLLLEGDVCSTIMYIVIEGEFEVLFTRSPTVATRNGNDADMRGRVSGADGTSDAAMRNGAISARCFLLLLLLSPVYPSPYLRTSSS